MLNHYKIVKKNMNDTSYVLFNNAKQLLIYFINGLNLFFDVLWFCVFWGCNYHAVLKPIKNYTPFSTI